MRVAVTGGTGVVGAAVVRHLIAAGHAVVALARSDRAAAALHAMGARPVPGDVLDRDSLRSLADGAEWLFHIAGVNEMCSRRPEVMDRVNIVGTRNTVGIAAEMGVDRVVCTSSAAAIGEPLGTVGDESTPHRGYYLSRYERSKHLAEQVARAEGLGLDLVVVNPSSVQGPGRATGTGRLVLDVLRGRLPYLVDTNVSLVDIDDCAAGHVLAAEKGKRGERYLLNGATISISELLPLLVEVSGIEVRARFVAGWAAEVGAVGLSLAARLTGRDSPLCREALRVLKAGHRYDGSRAAVELGLVYRPLEDTVSRTVEWFRSEGLLN